MTHEAPSVGPRSGDVLRPRHDFHHRTGHISARLGRGAPGAYGSFDQRRLRVFWAARSYIMTSEDQRGSDAALNRDLDLYLTPSGRGKGAFHQHGPGLCRRSHPGEPVSAGSGRGRLASGGRPAHGCLSGPGRPARVPGRPPLWARRLSAVRGLFRIHAGALPHGGRSFKLPQGAESTRRAATFPEPGGDGAPFGRAAG